MTTNSATYPATFAPAQRPDPVRARVNVQLQLTNDQIEGHNTIHILPEAKNGGPRRPHPGDIVYWVACVGGACLLLLAATT